MMQSKKNILLPEGDFPHLQKFGAFLLAHHLQETTEANIALARQAKLPLLEVLSHLSEQDLVSIVREGLETFYHHLQEQTALEQAKENLRKWRKDTLPNVPRSGVATADLVLVYHVRKQLLLSFVDRYTHNITLGIAIARELDLLFARVEEFAFSLYVDLKEEEHRTVLQELQDKNNDLATALEELQAAEEQLVETNNELEERVKARTGALAASEQQLRTITDALPGLITYIDREERYRFINQTYEKWFGIPRSQVLGNRLEEVLASQLGESDGAEAYDQIKIHIKHALQGEQVQYTNTLITKEGKLRHVLVNYVPQIEGGKVLGYYALFTDISEQVEAEKALKQSEARFSNIFNQSSVGMAEVDLRGKFVLVNDRYCQLVGRSREALYQIRMQDISHEGDVPQNMSLFQKAIEKGTPFTIEKRYTRPDGSQVWVRNNVSVIKDHQQQPLSLVAVCQDITEKKMAEQALQENKDLFQSFADTIQSLAWMSDTTGKVLWYNQRWYNYTGTTFEEMQQQQGWLNFLHPDHTNRVLDHVKSARAKGENWELTIPLKRADGEWGWFLARAIAIKDADGNIIRWIGTSTEITEQVIAQQQLQKANDEIVELLQREKLALAEANAQRSTLYNTFMQAPSLLCILRGRELVFELANPYYLEVFELREAIEGKRLDEVFPNPDPSIIAIHHQVLDTGIPYVGVELPVLSDWKHTGKPYTRYFNVRYAPLQEAGSIKGIITFGYEVTDHVSARLELEQNAVLMQEMNKELNQKYVELSRINNDLDNFIYTASHDLRSPLINLEGLLLALNKRLTGAITPEVANVLLLAGASIEKLKRTIKDLTEITKAQKSINDVREAISFKEILEDIKSDLPEDPDTLNAFIREDFQVASILYSRAGLRTILYNLLSNAIKYKAEDRPLEICISTQQEDRYIVLTIEDNGLGIAEHQLPKLFSMFQRLHTHVEGTGIGLYMIKRVIENSGGKIEVKSQLDKGSSFKVYLAE